MLVVFLSHKGGDAGGFGDVGEFGWLGEGVPGRCDEGNSRKNRKNSVHEQNSWKFRRVRQAYSRRRTTRLQRQHPSSPAAAPRLCNNTVRHRRLLRTVVANAGASARVRLTHP